MLPQPPYALAVPEFRFRALAALAGRAPLGGEREVALAALMAARLTSAALPPHALGAASRASRVAGARAWFASLALPPRLRAPFVRLVDATASDNDATLRAALGNVLEATQALLEPMAFAELRAIARALDHAT